MRITGRFVRNKKNYTLETGFEPAQPKLIDFKCMSIQVYRVNHSATPVSLGRAKILLEYIKFSVTLFV